MNKSVETSLLSFIVNTIITPHHQNEIQHVMNKYVVSLTQEYASHSHQSIHCVHCSRMNINNIFIQLHMIINSKK
jgi:hypothetical protein